MTSGSTAKGFPTWFVGGGSSRTSKEVVELTQGHGFQCTVLGVKHRNKNVGKFGRLFQDVALRFGVIRVQRPAQLKLLSVAQAVEVKLFVSGLRLTSWKRILITFADISEIQLGKHTQNFQRYGSEISDSFCFSILVRSSERLRFASLDVVCSTAKARDKVASLLNVAVSRARWFSDPLSANSQLSKQRDVFWAEQFRKFDSNGDGTLSLEELGHMLVHLGFPETSADLASRWADGDGNLRFSVEEFISFCHKVRSVESLKPLYNELWEKQRLLAAEGSKRADDAEHTEVSTGTKDSALEVGDNVNVHHEGDQELRKDGLEIFLRDQGEGDENEAHALVILERFAAEEGRLDFAGFCDYVLSTRMNPATRFAPLDEDLPLSDYLISSSHNTYLLADQLSGSCGIVAYVNAYRQGFRCVEVDAHDGRRGPCITHGNTLTERLSFEEFVKVTKEHAFRKSHHPLIISLENHCSPSQEAVMARCMRDVWGDENIFRSSADRLEKLPTLRELRRKYILKAKVIPGVTHPELAQLIFLMSTSAKSSSSSSSSSSESILSTSANTMLSLEEDAAKQDEAPMAASCRKFATNHLVRVYPKGRRVYSSNFNPIHAWSRGYQLAALNCQTHCQKYRINQVLFQEDTKGFLPLSSIGSLNIDQGDPVSEIRVLMGYLLPRSKVSAKIPRLKVSVFLYDLLSPRVRLESFWASSEDVNEDDDADEADMIGRSLSRHRAFYLGGRRRLHRNRTQGTFADRDELLATSRQLLQDDDNDEEVKNVASRRRLAARRLGGMSSRRNPRRSTNGTTAKRRAKAEADFETDAVVGNSFNPVFSQGTFRVPSHSKSTMVLFTVTDQSTNNKARAFGGSMLSRLRSGIRALPLLDPSGIPFEGGTCLLLQVKREEGSSTSDIVV